MTSRGAPPPRPALRKADDAFVHPATPGAKPRKPDLHTRPGRSTSDVMRASKDDPLVTMKAVVPKSVRKELNRQAKVSGTTAETLAGRIIVDFLKRG